MGWNAGHGGPRRQRGAAGAERPVEPQLAGCSVEAPRTSPLRTGNEHRFHAAFGYVPCSDLESGLYLRLCPSRLLEACDVQVDECLESLHRVGRELPHFTLTELVVVSSNRVQASQCLIDFGQMDPV